MKKEEENIILIDHTHVALIWEKIEEKETHYGNYKITPAKAFFVERTGEKEDKTWHRNSEKKKKKFL